MDSINSEKLAAINKVYEAVITARCVMCKTYKKSIWLPHPFFNFLTCSDCIQLFKLTERPRVVRKFYKKLCVVCLKDCCKLIECSRCILRYCKDCIVDNVKSISSITSFNKIKKWQCFRCNKKQIYEAIDEGDGVIATQFKYHFSECFSFVADEDEDKDEDKVRVKQEEADELINLAESKFNADHFYIFYPEFHPNNFVNLDDIFQYHKLITPGIYDMTNKIDIELRDIYEQPEANCSFSSFDRRKVIINLYLYQLEAHLLCNLRMQQLHMLKFAYDHLIGVDETDMSGNWFGGFCTSEKDENSGKSDDSLFLVYHNSYYANHRLLMFSFFSGVINSPIVGRIRMLLVVNRDENLQFDYDKDYWTSPRFADDFLDIRHIDYDDSCERYRALALLNMFKKDLTNGCILVLNYDQFVNEELFDSHILPARPSLVCFDNVNGKVYAKQKRKKVQKNVRILQNLNYRVKFLYFANILNLNKNVFKLACNEKISTKNFDVSCLFNKKSIFKKQSSFVILPDETTSHYGHNLQQQNIMYTLPLTLLPSSELYRLKTELKIEASVYYVRMSKSRMEAQFTQENSNQSDDFSLASETTLSKASSRLKKLSFMSISEALYKKNYASEYKMYEKYASSNPPSKLNLAMKLFSHCFGTKKKVLVFYNSRKITDFLAEQLPKSENFVLNKTFGFDNTFNSDWLDKFDDEQNKEALFNFCFFSSKKSGNSTDYRRVYKKVDYVLYLSVYDVYSELASLSKVFNLQQRSKHISVVKVSNSSYDKHENESGGGGGGVGGKSAFRKRRLTNEGTYNNEECRSKMNFFDVNGVVDVEECSFYNRYMHSNFTPTATKLKINEHGYPTALSKLD